MGLEGAEGRESGVTVESVGITAANPPEAIMSSAALKDVTNGAKDPHKRARRQGVDALPRWLPVRNGPQRSQPQSFAPQNRQEGACQPLLPLQDLTVWTQMVGAGLHECNSDFSRGCKSLNWSQTFLQVLMVQHAPLLPQQHTPLQPQLPWASTAAAGKQLLSMAPPWPLHGNMQRQGSASSAGSCTGGWGRLWWRSGNWGWA